METIQTSSASEALEKMGAGTYYLTQETRALLSMLYQSMMQRVPTEETEEALVDIADRYWNDLIGVMRKAFQTVVAFDEGQINTALESMLREELSLSPEAVILCLDRFLLREAGDLPVERMEICRYDDGSRDARPNTLPVEEQLNAVQDALQERPIILVDDGLFSGGTLSYAIQKLQERGLAVTKIVTFLKAPDAQEVQGIPVRVERVLDRRMIDWNDARDLSTFGGRTVGGRERVAGHPFIRENKRGKATTCPYFAPYSDGSSASIDCLSRATFLEVSRDLLRIEATMLEEFQQISGREVSLRDMWNAGFATPYGGAMPLVPQKRKLMELNRLAQSIIECKQLPRIEQLIMDMDGTLYDLDGEDDGFVGSSLDRAVQQKTIMFIQKRESCSYAQAECIAEEAFGDPIGASAFLSERYGVSRTEYFEETWGRIDPKTVVQNGKESCDLLRKLRSKVKGLYLLTGAPACWRENVLNYLTIEEDLFDAKFSAEDFGAKSEIFQALRSNLPSDTFLSVGDTFDSDIQPARECGMYGFLVSRAQPLYSLPSKLPS